MILRPTSRLLDLPRGLRRTITALAVCLTFAAGPGAAPPDPSPYWKNQVRFPDDSFIVMDSYDQPGWVKFTILVEDQATVYFQDSLAYRFHYDFAVNELPSFAGMTPEQFDQVSLYATGQQAILGAVLVPPLVGYEHAIPEYGIQFVRRDPYARETVRDLFATVRAAVLAGPEVEAFYFPTFEQQEVADTNAAWFASQGITVSSTGRWAAGDSCYAHGWALGELKFVPGAQIDAAFTSGALAPDDILLTDAVPSEIPMLAGVVTLSPSTPNSHVAILAQTFGVPFVHAALDETATRAQNLIGHRVVLRADDRADHCMVRLVDTDGVLGPGQEDEILALKMPPPLNISAVEPYGAYSAPTGGLQLADIRFFGGKASNTGVLRRAIPANSPVSAAFSFDLWTAFLMQDLGGGQTLRDEIDDRLAGYVYPPDVGALAVTLESIRDLIKDDGQTDFDPVLESAVITTLQNPSYGFDPYRKIRFRSSTNVEDSEQFTGAGLYDSFSGCLADDLDGNSGGPSHCDPSQSNERGVFRAIRKVFASFYNLNAFLERLRHGIDEHDVGMALLVHHSFPDDDELANGVGTLWRVSGITRDAYLVTQLGAVSVTNPDPGSIPEEMDIYVSFTGTIYPTLIQGSNLVPLGSAVMVDPGDYVALTELLLDAAAEYDIASGVSAYTLEFEYKKTAPGSDLVVTQVRRIPEASDVPSVTPFLINEPTGYCLFQGEHGDAFGNHRLKSTWQLATRSLWLTEQNLADGFMTDAELRYTEGCRRFRQGGPLPHWPEPWHIYAADASTDGWRFGGMQNPRDHRLTLNQVPQLVAPSKSPVLVLSDFGWTYDYSDFGCVDLRVDYEDPVPAWDWEGPTTTTTDYGVLCRCPGVEVGDQLQQRWFDPEQGVTVSTEFYWPPPVDVAAGYTAPLARFVETVITGLTTQPLVLHDAFAQTYRPEHHNFAEHFLFEPVLDPGLTQAQRDELTLAGVRVIHATDALGPPQITIYDDAAWGDVCLDCPGGDVDADGRCAGDPIPDCDDGSEDLWAAPGETRDLRFLDGSSIVWSPPGETGGDLVRYDLLRSPAPMNFVLGTICLESDDGSDLGAVDLATPGAGGYFYLVRGGNDCPAGEGSLGEDSDGVPRVGRVCP